MCPLTGQTPGRASPTRAFGPFDNMGDETDHTPPRGLAQTRRVARYVDIADTTDQTPLLYRPIGQGPTAGTTASGAPAARDRARRGRIAGRRRAGTAPSAYADGGRVRVTEGCSPAGGWARVTVRSPRAGVGAGVGAGGGAGAGGREGDGRLVGRGGRSPAAEAGAALRARRAWRGAPPATPASPDRQNFQRGASRPAQGAPRPLSPRTQL